MGTAGKHNSRFIVGTKSICMDISALRCSEITIYVFNNAF